MEQEKKVNEKGRQRGSKKSNMNFKSPKISDKVGKDDRQVHSISESKKQKESVPRPVIESVEDTYMKLMKALQFDTYEMLAKSGDGYRFTISHHYETNIRMTDYQGYPGRSKRLAEESLVLSSSLPLSCSSTIFLRRDTDRLDIMKALITGPADTPYANGCFEFDIYFPPSYPNTPLNINLETTGRNTVRFNPNLYSDGKVCLSLLNTWYGSPEERWTSHSSVLQVLVSIQSMVLVSEPFFNEPIMDAGKHIADWKGFSQAYNCERYPACVRFAMLGQITNPCPCFKEIIHTHFWLKRNEICKQIEGWIVESNKQSNMLKPPTYDPKVLPRQYQQLREELAKLPPPPGYDEKDYPFSVGHTPRAV